MYNRQQWEHVGGNIARDAVGDKIRDGIEGERKQSFFG